MSTVPSRVGTPSDWARVLATGPHYEPPYPGAVQDELAWHLVKVLRDDVHIRSEVEVEIPASSGWPEHGTGPAFFTLDLVVEVPVGLEDGVPVVRRVAFEAASGRTLRDHERRLRRDATLLSHGVVDTIYRLRGSDLLGHMDDVLYLASQWEEAGDGDPFSDRGRINLKTLSSREARQVELRPEQPSALVPYTLEDGSSPDRHLWHVANKQAPHILVRRLDRRFPSVWGPYAERSLRKVEVDRPILRRAS